MPGIFWLAERTDSFSVSLLYEVTWHFFGSEIGLQWSAEEEPSNKDLDT